MSNTNYNVHTIAPNTYLIDEFGLDTAYLLVGSERALLIDTGTGVADLRALVEKLTDKPYDVAATHGHVDHVGGCVQFESLYIHPADMEMVNSDPTMKREYARRMIDTYPERGAGFALEDIVEGPLPKMIPMREGFVFELGNRGIEVFEVPGHSAGSVVFLDRTERILISGDALNPLFLLVMPAPTRMDAVRSFLAAARRIQEMADAFDATYGGHCTKEPLDPQNLRDLIACAEGILDGTILPKHKTLHIFSADFYVFGTANILLDL